MVAQRIDWPAVRELTPAIVEALADPAFPLDAAIDEMARAGGWADFQIKHTRAELHELGTKLQEAIGEWSTADIDAFAERLSKRLRLAGPQRERFRAALQRLQRTVAL